MGITERRMGGSTPPLSLYLLGGSFMAGGVIGSVLAGLMPQGSAQALADYLVAFLSLLEQGTFSPELMPMLWEQLRLWLAMGILGLTALGVVGIPLLLGVRGFLLAFSVGGFCRVFGPAGLLPSVYFFGLAALLTMPVLFFSGMQGFERGLLLLSHALGVGEYTGRVGSYLAVWLLCGLGLVVAVCVQVLLLPVLMPLAVGVL